MRRHDDAGARTHPGNLLDGNDVAHVVRAGAALLLRVRHAHEVHFGQFRQKLMRETVVAVEFGRDRRHLSLGELPDSIPDQLLLIGQLEVHSRFLYSRPSPASLWALPLLVTAGTKASGNSRPTANSAVNAQFITAETRRTFAGPVGAEGPLRGRSRGGMPREGPCEGPRGGPCGGPFVPAVQGGCGAGGDHGGAGPGYDENRGGPRRSGRGPPRRHTGRRVGTRGRDYAGRSRT